MGRICEEELEIYTPCVLIDLLLYKNLVPADKRYMDMALLIEVGQKISA
jgi:hypothetical protein